MKKLSKFVYKKKDTKIFRLLFKDFQYLFKQNCSVKKAEYLQTILFEEKLNKIDTFSIYTFKRATVFTQKLKIKTVNFKTQQFFYVICAHRRKGCN